MAVTETWKPGSGPRGRGSGGPGAAERPGKEPGVRAKAQSRDALGNRARVTPVEREGER